MNQSEVSGDSSAAREVVYRQLAAMARSRAQLRSTLIRRGFAEATAEEVLAEFTELGLVDDASFAQEWVRSRHLRRGLSRFVLARELSQRGIAEDIAEAALALIEPESELAAAESLARKRLRATGPPSSRTEWNRLLAYLARRGYSRDIALPVIRHIAAEISADFDETEFADSDL